MAAHLSIEESLAEVLAAHSIGAFSGDSTACQCDRTWRKNADHRKHLTEALAAALVPVIAEAQAEAYEKGHLDGDLYQYFDGMRPRKPNPYRSNDD